VSGPGHEERMPAWPTVMHFTDATEFGGAERMIVTLMAALPAYGWQSILVHHAEPGIRRLIDETKSLGIETRVAPPMQGSGRWRTVLHFARQLRRWAPDVFHAHLSSPSACRHALIAARLAGLPVVATVQLYLPVRGVRATYRQRLLSLGVDRYIAVSDEVARRMRGLCINASRKIRVVYNGVPVDEFDQDPGDSVRDAGSRPTVLAVARLHPQKGLSYLLEAATLLPDVRFLVAGDGSERSELEQQARNLRLGDRVEFLGERDDVPRLLRQADVFVLPSLYEGLPVSVLEAMAAGTPVVATAVGGTDEAVVCGETGILVPPRDPQALAKALREILSSAPLARKFIAGAKARVRTTFSAEAVARGVSAVYGELCPRRRRPTR
jgi:glycosyltransferase involved in cell wall biosynthesis